jgi:hypothetical protein
LPGRREAPPPFLEGSAHRHGSTLLEQPPWLLLFLWPGRHRQLLAKPTPPTTTR